MKTFWLLLEKCKAKRLENKPIYTLAEIWRVIILRGIQDIYTGVLIFVKEVHR